MEKRKTVKKTGTVGSVALEKEVRTVKDTSGTYVESVGEPLADTLRRIYVMLRGIEINSVHDELHRDFLLTQVDIWLSKYE